MADKSDFHFNVPSLAGTRFPTGALCYTSRNANQNLIAVLGGLGHLDHLGHFGV